MVLHTMLKTSIRSTVNGWVGGGEVPLHTAYRYYAHHPVMTEILSIKRAMKP